MPNEVQSVQETEIEEVQHFLRAHEESSQLLKDCRDVLGHSKRILFTGETDLPARKLYESIGYEEIGHFALILG